MLKLKFVKGEHKEVDLSQARMTIGRDASNDICLTADGVSGFHAEIQTEDGKSFIVDLGSTNGTFVNGKKVSGRQQLSAWESIRFDKVEAEVSDTERRRPTQVNRAVTDADLKQPAANATQVRPAVGGWMLVGKSGPVAGKSFPLQGTMSIGREDGCDLQIADEMLSRRHAELTVSGSGLTLKDSGSANGTFVNGKKVGEATLKVGDEVCFDKVAFRVEGPVADSGKTSVRPAVAPSKSATAVRPAVAGATRASAAIPAVELIAPDGQKHPLQGASVTVGRTPENDICLDNETVSGGHARLTSQGGVWTVEDLGSTNGTFVDDKKVSSQRLKAGDKVRFGKVELVFKAPQERASGTQVVPALDKKGGTAVQPTVKKGLPGWSYGLLGFVVVGVVLAVVFGGDFLGGSSPKQIDAKLQSGKVWSQHLSAGRSGPTTPLLADINGDNYLDVIVADADGYVLAMDGAEGKKIFEAEAAGRILAPPVSGDLSGDGFLDIVIASNSGQVVAMNGKGQALWKSDVNLELGDILNRPVLSAVNSDGVDDVVVPTGAKGLVALDGSRGWKIWDTAEMTKGKVIASPLVADINDDDQTDYIAVTDSGQVLAVTTQGDKVWQLWEATLPPSYYASPAYVEVDGQALIVVATDGGGIFALNAATGRSYWTAKVNKRFFASPVAVDADGDEVADIVAIAENGDVHVLSSLTGDEIWSSALGCAIQASPALYDVNSDGLRDLIIPDSLGQVRIIDMARGREVLTIKVAGADAFLASPVLGDVNSDELIEIVTASQNGMVCAYGLNRVAPKSEALWPMFLGNDRHSL